MSGIGLTYCELFFTPGVFAPVQVPGFKFKCVGSQISMVGWVRILAVSLSLSLSLSLSRATFLGKKMLGYATRGHTSLGLGPFWETEKLVPRPK